MKALLVAASALAIATPALAQTTSTEPSMSPSSSAPQSAAPQSAVPPSDASAATPAPVQDAKAIIAAEFPIYDKDSSGALNKGEFETWMVALKSKSDTAPMKAAEKASWVKTAFTTADKDKDKAVSLAELTDYLTAQG